MGGRGRPVRAHAGHLGASIGLPKADAAPGNSSAEMGGEVDGLQPMDLGLRR
jgi:hypothetical protein